MIVNFIKNIFLILSLSITFSAFSQKTSDPEPNITFVEHKVLKKETSYSISKKYGITIETLKLYNPDKIDNLKKKDIVKIPVFPKYKTGIRKIEKGDTYYNLAVKYKTQIATLKRLNNNKSPLSIGDEIIYPITSTNTKNDNLKNTPKEEIKYISYKVKQGDTYYNIAKNFDINPNDLMAENDDKVTLKPDMEINIPIIIKKKTISHKVNSGETLYSIAKKYNTEIKNISDENNNFPNIITIGQKLNIEVAENQEALKYLMPKESDYKVLEKNIYNNDKKAELKFKKEYNITILMPFDADNKNFDVESKASYEFLNGFKMTLDSLKKIGLNSTINVLDSKNSLEYIKTLYENNPTIKNSDIVYSPFNKEQYVFLTEMAKKDDFDLISIENQSNQYLEKNPNIIELIPSLPTQVEYICKYISKRFKNEDISILTFKSNNANDEILSKIAKNSIIQNEKHNFNIFDYTDFESIKEKFSKTRKNIIILSMIDNSLNSNFISKFKEFIKLNPEILYEIYMTEHVKTKINNSMIKGLKCSYVQNYYFENNKFNSNFSSKYKELYSVNPGKYAVLGYNSALFFGTALKKYGVDFKQHMKNIKLPLSNIKYNIVQTQDNCGFENNEMYMLNIDDKGVVTCLN